MNKFITIVAVILTIVFLGACRHSEAYDFLYTLDEVLDVSIVNVSFDDAGGVIQTELLEVDNKDEFFKDFKKVDCYTYYGDPQGITDEGIQANVIKIEYKNGEYELINWCGQAEYLQEKGLCYYAGYSIFDEKQFEELIQKYISNLYTAHSELLLQ